MAGEVVAYLEVMLDGRDADGTQNDIEIRGSEQFYLGRNGAVCRLAWPDPVISNKHLRIHCILYEQDPVAGIPPFVYATDISSNGTYLKKANSECASSKHRGIRMGRDCTFLLDDGDELRLSESVTLIFRSLTAMREVPLSANQQREKQLFSSRYVITSRCLGAGGFGKVMVGIHQKTQRQVACKIIDLRNMWSKLPASNLELPTKDYGQTQEDDTTTAKNRWPGKVARCFREFDILKDLSHPNIIAIEKVFWSSNTIYIFQDLVTGGDLFSYLEYNGGCLKDVETALIIKQVLTGLQYLHSKNIVHRDLKPDNILMSSLDEGTRAVITDFGNARYLPSVGEVDPEELGRRQRMFSYTGTLEYAAPEIHRKNKTIAPHRGYSKAVDMWSVGAITATLLSGDVIFAPQGLPRSDPGFGQAFLRLASRCDLSFLDNRRNVTWKNVGFKAKHFIKHLLVLNEERRMTVTEALAHAWFSNTYHVAVFNEVYKKSTREWQPRKKDSRLVESISEISAEIPKALVSQRFLTQEVVSRYFTPPSREPSALGKRKRITGSQHRRANTPLPTIVEEVQADLRAQGRYEFPQSHEPVQDSYSPEESIDNSLEQLSLGHEYEGRYAADDNIRASPIRDSGQDGEDIYAGFDSISNFSIPGPPPLGSPELNEDLAENDSNIVPDTPIRGTKRHPQLSPNHSPNGSGIEDESQSCVKKQKPASYHATELSVRKRPRHKYY